MYQLQILESAHNEMRDSYDWYEAQQPGLGNRFINMVIKAMRIIEKNPQIYDAKFSRKFRFAKVKDFPFFVVYKIKRNIVVVHAVFHNSRNPKSF